MLLALEHVLHGRLAAAVRKDTIVAGCLPIAPPSLPLAVDTLRTVFGLSTVCVLRSSSKASGGHYGCSPFVIVNHAFVSFLLRRLP